MPELPEVEQVRISLVPHVVGRTITAVQVDVAKMVRHPGVEEFRKNLVGRTITAVGRRGKYLRLELDDGTWLLVHLRMTGALLAVKKELPEPRFTHLVFQLDGPENLYFTDIRKFGVVALMGRDGYQDKGYASLGPEPLDGELTPQYLKEKARGKTAVLKAFLLDQSVIARNRKEGNRMTVIGLTGGIASGKSTVSAYLKEKGIPVFDADASAWEVEKAGQPCLQQLVEAFGKGILTPEGELDRSHMARLAFHDPRALQQLNAIVHRAVEDRRDRFLADHAGDAVVVLDAPLLLECGWEKKADTVWLVDIDPEQQIQRAMKRSGMTRQEVVDRINRQMPLEEKRKKADTIIDNSGTLEELYQKVEKALRGLSA